MIRYIIKRTGSMLLTLLVVSALVFIVIQLPPGDYLSTYIAELESQGEKVSLAQVVYLKEQFGLDRSGLEQYFLWLWGMLQGDFGYSFEYRLPVADVVGDAMMMTLVLNLVTIAFIYLVAFPIGYISAVKQYSVWDYILSFIGFLGLATPNFLFALILLYLGNVWFGTSIGGLTDPQYADQPWTFAKIMSFLGHIWAPVIVIGTAGTASMIRRLRANLLDELDKPYVTTARAKGLPMHRLRIKYPLRMALNPFVADIGNLLPQIVSGSVIVSAVMSLPTTGPILLRALQTQDTYLAGSFLMFLAVLTVVGMFLSDLALAVLDPRIRLGQGHKAEGGK